MYICSNTIVIFFVDYLRQRIITESLRNIMYGDYGQEEVITPLTNIFINKKFETIHNKITKCWKIL